MAALAAGSHVLCDKPLGATVPDIDHLAGARDWAGRFVMVGYQWSYSAAIQALKRDLLAGRYGRPLRLATLCAWPRDMAYYRRNTWAGRLRDAASGAWVLDSPANNAMAHFLHNALFVVGPAMTRSALPAAVTAELARAYPIESADTAACRVLTEDGCEVLFLASHVTAGPLEPRFRLECEGGVIVYGERDWHVVGRPKTAASRTTATPTPRTSSASSSRPSIFVRSPAGVVACGVEAAAAQTVCVVAMHESSPAIVRFPALLRRGHPDDRVGTSSRWRTNC